MYSSENGEHQQKKVSIYTDAFSCPEHSSCHNSFITYKAYINQQSTVQFAPAPSDNISPYATKLLL
jgi:hypothetical protein